MKARHVLFVCFAAATIAAFALGRLYQAQQSQSANDLLKAGFTITDPEGHEISKFDG